MDPWSQHSKVKISFYTNDDDDNDDDDYDEDDELFLKDDWPMEAVYSYFQLGPLLDILTILRNKHYTMVPQLIL